MQSLNLDDVESRLNGIIDPEEVLQIDFEGLDSSAKTEARNIIEAISQLYCNETFLAKNPSFKRRIDADLESLRINLRMRKADEIAHDSCLRNISLNPGNASMYRSLVEIQRTQSALTTKIEDTIDKLSKFIKGYQQELNFDAVETKDDDEPEIDQNTHRGSKAFIESMCGDD